MSVWLYLRRGHWWPVFVPTAICLRIMLANLLNVYLDKTQLRLCPKHPPNLYGPSTNLFMSNVVSNESAISELHPDIQEGGHWQPVACVPLHRVALILPYRDRATQLHRLLHYLIPILKRQLLQFVIVVTEQSGSGHFNKGRIMNAAFSYVEQHLQVDCVVFHDVDMLPKDDRNYYGCPDQPRHIGSYVDSLNYRVVASNMVGGVLAMRLHHYRLINGFSNVYWGWGGEDDDIGNRILSRRLHIERPLFEYGQYVMAEHSQRKRLSKRLVFELLKDSERRSLVDGLNQKRWNITKVTKRALYYHIMVEVGHVPKGWQKSLAPRTTQKPSRH